MNLASGHHLEVLSRARPNASSIFFGELKQGAVKQARGGRPGVQTSSGKRPLGGQQRIGRHTLGGQLIVSPQRIAAGALYDARQAGDLALSHSSTPSPRSLSTASVRIPYICSGDCCPPLGRGRGLDTRLMDHPLPLGSRGKQAAVRGRRSHLPAPQEFSGSRTKIEALVQMVCTIKRPSVPSVHQ